jgi:ribonucleoside-diphosphate reductase alpha chain
LDASAFVLIATGTNADASKTAPQEENGNADQGDTDVQVARMKGYEGDACPVCGHFTLVRNGTCMRCDTCGSTTGCS